VDCAVEGGVEVLCEMLGFSIAARTERQGDICPELLRKAAAVVVDAVLPREMRRVRTSLV
jgi:hypothetical protein